MEKETPSVVVTHDDGVVPSRTNAHDQIPHASQPSSTSCDSRPSFSAKMASFPDTAIPRMTHSTRLLSVDEVMSLVSNAGKRNMSAEGGHERSSSGYLDATNRGGGHLDASNRGGHLDASSYRGPFDASYRGHRLASADNDAAILDEYSDVTSDGTLSRCTSTDRISLADGLVEDRFRVDRRKLEAMILGCPPDPCDFEIMRLPIGSDGRILSADDFFAKVMGKTSTEIRYPRLLKVGARNRKDPHVRITGSPENVTTASHMVRMQLEPHNKITMKMDVSWTHHSHIIGKAGNTIQPVVRRTGVSIHFPDGNKNNEIRKSNQVSINSRGEELGGLEDARASIRQLTPLIFTFSLNANAKYISITEPNMLVQQVQGVYNVQVELSVTGGAEPQLLGSVRGSELDVVRVKEATFTLLHNLCGSIASHLTVQMKIEVSPQHHSFVLGRNNETVKRIMQITHTQIHFPDINDTNLGPLQKSTIVIAGAIDNVYAARQNIVGALPLVLMFETGGNGVSVEEIAQLMQSFNLSIIPKPTRTDGRRAVVIKGAERDAAHIYEAWKLVTGSDKGIPVGKIPPSYFISSTPLPSSFLTSGSGPSQGWTGHHPRTSSTSLSPNPFAHNLPSPLTPAFPPPTPTFPPHNTSAYHSVSPVMGGGIWGGPSSAPPHNPGAGTNFPFPAPPSMLYGARGNNSMMGGGNNSGSNYLSSGSLANLAALTSLNSSSRNSPTYSNTAHHFFGGSHHQQQQQQQQMQQQQHHRAAANMFSSNHGNDYMLGNASFAPMNAGHSAAAATNTNAANMLNNNQSSSSNNNNNNYLLNSVMGSRGMYSSLGGGNNASNMDSSNSMMPSSSMPTVSEISAALAGHPRQQQQQQAQYRLYSQQDEASAQRQVDTSADDRAGGSSSCSSGGAPSPGLTSPNDSSTRDSSPDMVVLGHIQSPPLVGAHRHQPPHPVARSLHAQQQGGSGELDGSPDLAVRTRPNASDLSSPPDQTQRSRDLSSLLSEFCDRRAPGCEKGLHVALQKLKISDYEAKQILANKAMREPVGGTVRVPTSNWSGYGFSKSSPTYQIRKQFQEAGLLKKTVDCSTNAPTQQWAEGGDKAAQEPVDENANRSEGYNNAGGGNSWSTGQGSLDQQEGEDATPGTGLPQRPPRHTPATTAGETVATTTTTSEGLQQLLSAVTTEEDWPSDSKWSCNDGTSSPGAVRSAAIGVDSGLAASITSSNQASLSLSDPESSDGFGNSGSSGCSYSSSGSSSAGTAAPGDKRPPPRLSASSFSECVAAARRWPPQAAPALSDLPQVLQSLGMSQYIDLFNSQEVDLAMFLSLKDSELKELGISAFGHRKRLLIAIKHLTSSLPEYGSAAPLKPARLQHTASGGSDPSSGKTVSWNC